LSQQTPGGLLLFPSSLLENFAARLLLRSFHLFFWTMIVVQRLPHGFFEATFAL
jgi:hypothetical protein